MSKFSFITHHSLLSSNRREFINLYIAEKDTHSALVADSMGLPYSRLHSRLRKTRQSENTELKVRYDHSRSSKLVPIKKPVCDFLYHCVNSNLNRISHRFRDMRYKGRKTAFFIVLPAPVSFEDLARGVPWDLGYESWC